MNYRPIFAIVLLVLLAPVKPVVAMDLSIRVESLGTPVHITEVQCVFNAGTSVADTLVGTTDLEGMVYFSHDVVSAVEDTPTLVVSSPYPNPAGSTAVFGLSGGDKSFRELSFSLFDLRGRRVAHGGVQDGGIELPRPLASGTYLYRVMDGTRTKASGKLTMLGELERVQFETATAPKLKKSPSHLVEIRVERQGFEDYFDSMVLPDGQHDLEIILVPVYCLDSDCPDCDACNSFMAWIAERIDETGASTYIEIQAIVLLACEHYPSDVRDRCSGIIYPNQETITTELILGTPWYDMCPYMGYCSE